MDDTKKVRQLLADLPEGLEIKLQPGLKRPWLRVGDVILVDPAAWEEFKRPERVKGQQDG